MSKSKQTTAKGFRIFAMDEEGRRRVRVVESSLACRGAHAWIFTDPAPGYPVEQLHLGVADARLIISGLERFVAAAAAGELREPEARKLDTTAPSRGTTNEER